MSTSEPVTTSAWAISTGFDILLHTIASTREGAQRAWAREMANVRAGEDAILQTALDAIWQQHGVQLGMRAIPISVEEQR